MLLKNILLLIIFSMILRDPCQAYFLNENLEILVSPTSFVNKLATVLEAENDKISTECARQMKEYMEGLKMEKLWAMKMFDSSSKIPGGILQGNLVDFGFFDECLSVEGNISTVETVFGKYCLGTLPFDFIAKSLSQFGITNSTVPPYEIQELTSIQLATCFPESCSGNDVEIVYNGILEFTAMKFDGNLCQTKKTTNLHLDTGSIVAICFLGVILCLMITSTLYDTTLYYLKGKPLHPILLAFSVITNGRKVTSIIEGDGSNAANKINCLHGLRVISTVWIIMGHRYLLNLISMIPMQNSIEGHHWFQRRENMLIIQTSMAVDTFFLMSGLLVSYISINAFKRGIKIHVLYSIFHRYLRLTPVLAVTILLQVTIVKYLGSGPLWPKLMYFFLYSCGKNWWKTLLYIQNFQDDFTCLPQTWYLAVDMQLFLLSPILLLALKRMPKFALWFTGFLITCSIVVSFLTSWILEVGPTHMQGIKYMSFYYSAPWTRAAPWLMGFLLGYTMYQTKVAKTIISIHKGMVLLLWCIALAVLTTCVFAGHSIQTQTYDKLPTAFYLALVRPSWAIAVSWVIFACANDYGGPINSFLSLPIFQILSKFTYGLYVVHNTVIPAIIGQMKTPPIITNSYMYHVFWGDFAACFAVCVILTLAIEMPLNIIERFLFKRDSEQKELKEV